MAMFLADDAGARVAENTMGRMQLLLSKGETDPFLQEVFISAIGVLRRAELAPSFDPKQSKMPPRRAPHA